MKILLCVTEMPYAEPTVQFGSAIAGITSSAVTLLNVVGRKEEKTASEPVFAAARAMLPDLAVSTRVRRGDPAERILAEIREGEYDLAILGANQAPGLGQRLLGSVAAQVVRRAPISVLIVRPPLPEMERFLLCTGGLQVAEPVIEAGACLAEAASAEVTLLHVTSPVPSMYTGLNEIEETLTELLQTDTTVARHLRTGAEILAQYHTSATLKLRYGVAADEILREAQEGAYSLIVIGASGSAGRLRGWLVGDITRQVIDSAPCSVLVVRKKSEGPGLFVGTR